MPKPYDWKLIMTKSEIKIITTYGASEKKNTSRK